MISMRVARRATIDVIDRRPEEDLMEPVPLLNRAGRRRSPATLSGFHQDRPPRNKGLRHPADPPTVEEIIAVLAGIQTAAFAHSAAAYAALRRDASVLWWPRGGPSAHIAHPHKVFG